MSEPLKKALLELGRVVVLAAIPVTLAYLEILPYEWAAIITAALKVLDKYLHEVGKSDVDGKGSALVTGLTRF